MSNDWNLDMYQNRARRWRQEAGMAPPGRERDACVAIAEGYENLAAIIRTLTMPARAAPTNYSVDREQHFAGSWRN